MTFIKFFKQQFIDEGAITRKMLELVPDDKFDFKPHEKSMVMKDLATHIADLPGWIHMALTTDELDFAAHYEKPDVSDHATLMAFFDKRYNDGFTTLVADNEDLLNNPWTLRNGATIYSTEPKIDIIRMSFSQQIHHRAQLGVYLRLLSTRPKTHNIL